MKKLLLTCAAFMALLPATGAAARLGIFVGGPVIAPYGWYAPYYGYGFYPYGPYVGGPIGGEVKLDTKVKSAQVYINGGFAGTVGDLKTIRMRPGTYDFDIRAVDGHSFQQRVYVVAGKTTKLHPELGA
jgi:hypothetical protein